MSKSLDVSINGFFQALAVLSDVPELKNFFFSVNGTVAITRVLTEKNYLIINIL